jgi:hypothetical protein
MRVLLDESPCEMDARYVGEAIGAAATIAEGRGRMIIDVEVDGRPWSEAQLANLRGDRTEAAEIRLTTADPLALADQVLVDAADALDSADALQREAADLLEGGSRAEAMGRLSAALEAWSSVQRAVSLSAAVLDIDLDDLTVAESSTEQIVATLHLRLTAIRTALESADPVGLADGLRYELPEVVQQWRDLIESMRRALKGAP